MEAAISTPSSYHFKKTGIEANQQTDGLAVYFSGP